MKTIRSIVGMICPALALIANSSIGAPEQSDSNILGKIIPNNSLVVVNGFGPSIIHFFENGRFEHLGLNGKAGEGTWRIQGAAVCATHTNVPPGRVAKENCLEVQATALGQKWQGPIDPRNGPLFYQLFEGHPELSATRPK